MSRVVKLLHIMVMAKEMKPKNPITLLDDITPGCSDNIDMMNVFIMLVVYKIQYSQSDMRLCL